jgi:hypothetical protein
MPFASLYITGSLKDITGAGPGFGLTLLSKDCAIVAVTNSKLVAAIIIFFILCLLKIIFN